MTKFLVIPFLIVLISVSCRVTKEKDPGIKKFDIQQLIETDSQFSFSTIFSEVRFIPLETSEECVLGHIAHMKLFKDNFYILDRSISKGLYRFSMDGKFLNRIGQVGKGPGEYFEPFFFNINKTSGEVYILDITLRKVSTFDENGQFLRDFRYEKSLSPRTIGFQGNDLYATEMNIHDSDAKVLLLQFSKSGSVKKSWFKGEVPYTTNLGYPAWHFFDFQDRTIFYHESLSKSYIIQDERITPYFELTNGFIDIKLIRERELARQKLPKGERYGWDSRGYSNTGKAYALNNLFETNRLLHFKFYYENYSYNVFHLKKQDKTICTKGFVNDLALNGFRDFHDANEEFFISKESLSKRSVTRLKDNIEKGKIIIEDLLEKERLLQIDESDNPVILLYKIKDKIDL